jgi:hypothetical protein
MAKDKQLLRYTLAGLELTTYCSRGDATAPRHQNVFTRHYKNSCKTISYIFSASAVNLNDWEWLKQKNENANGLHFKQGWFSCS